MDFEGGTEWAGAFYEPTSFPGLFESQMAISDLCTPPMQARSVLPPSTDIDVDPIAYEPSPSKGDTYQVPTSELDENEDLDDQTEEDFANDQIEPQDPFTTTYNLRATTRDPQKRLATERVDHDNTGDYDPVAEAFKARPAKRKPRPIPKEVMVFDNDEMDCDEVEEVALRASQETLISKIIFTSDEAKLSVIRLLSLPPKPNPELSVDHGKRLDEVGDSGKGYNLRKQRPPKEEIPLADVSGRPIARGCRGCQTLKKHCSLLDDEFSWPCLICELHEADCVMIKEPVRKMACLRCIEMRQQRKSAICSFDYEDDVTGHCERCAREGSFECIAGPNPTTIPPRVRISKEGKPHINERPTYKPMYGNSCRACQTVERICSFAGDVIKDACIACDMDGLECQPILATQTRKAPRTRKMRAKKTPQQLAVRIAKHDSMPDTLRDLQIVKKQTSALQIDTTRDSPEDYGLFPETVGMSVRTCFHHPMAFNVDTQTSQDCNFCADPSYGMLGSEEREVEIIELTGGRGWAEISGGNEVATTSTTRVCGLHDGKNGNCHVRRSRHAADTRIGSGDNGR